MYLLHLIAHTISIMQVNQVEVAKVQFLVEALTAVRLWLMIHHQINPISDGG